MKFNQNMTNKLKDYISDLEREKKELRSSFELEFKKCTVLCTRESKQCQCQIMKNIFDIFHKQGIF